jgi:hypothetical protein
MDVGVDLGTSRRAARALPVGTAATAAGLAAILGIGLALAGPARPARADGLAVLDAADRELFCALGGDAYRPNRSWPTRPELREADRALEAVDVEICMARFDEALDRVEAARLRLAALPESWALRGRRARLEALAATAHVALGDEAAGRAAFARAVELDPHFELDPRRASPKLLRVFREAARSHQRGDPGDRMAAR